MFVVQFFDGLNDSDSSSKDLLANLMNRPLFGPFTSREVALFAARKGVYDRLEEVQENGLGYDPEVDKHFIEELDDVPVEEYVSGSEVLGYYIEPFDDGNRYVAVVSEVTELG